jgi:hypothetical protein
LVAIGLGMALVACLQVICTSTVSAFKEDVVGVRQK